MTYMYTTAAAAKRMLMFQITFDAINRSELAYKLIARERRKRGNKMIATKMIDWSNIFKNTYKIGC